MVSVVRQLSIAARPGLEPGTPRSKRGMISLSPSGCKRKARESNPPLPSGRTALAKRPGQPVSGYLPVDPPGIEPGSPVCRTGVVPLDHEPVALLPPLLLLLLLSSPTRRQEKSKSRSKSKSRVSKRKERESNPQGIAAQPFSRRLPSPIGLPFRAKQKSQVSSDTWLGKKRARTGCQTTRKQQAHDQELDRELVSG